MRQNRYGPPPEFPLASPYSGIVHYLSGPNRHTLTQIYQKISRGAPREAPTYIYFHYANGFTTQTLAHITNNKILEIPESFQS